MRYQAILLLEYVLEEKMKMKKKKKKKKIDCSFKDEILKRKEVTSFLQSLGNQLSTGNELFGKLWEMDVLFE
jgi:hypothetical protein